MENKHMLSLDTPVNLKEKAFFGAGAGGYAFTYVLFSSLMMFFYTNVVGLSSAAVGTMMLIASVWDGINDPLMGILVDRTNTRYGKCKPWILVGAVALAITTVLAFRFPANEAMRLPYAYVTYILYGMAITIFAMSCPVMMTRMTRDQVGVAKLNSWMYAGITIISVVASSRLMPLLNAFSGPEGNMTQGFGKLSLLAAAIALALPMFIVLGVKERAFTAETVKHEKISFGTYIKSLIKNKYFLILLGVASIVMVAYMLVNSSLMYYCTYNIQNAAIFSPLMSCSYVGTVAAIFGIPLLVKKFDKKNIFIAACLLIAVGCTARLITGDSSLTVLFAFSIFSFVGIGFFTMCLTPMLIDTAVYGMKNNGVDATGVVMSSITLVQKIGTGIGTAVLGTLMKKYGFDPSLPQQPDAVLSVFKHCSITAFLAAAVIAAVVIACFYKLTNKKLAEMTEQ